MNITTERGQLAHLACSESWIVRKDGIFVGHIERWNAPNRGTFSAYGKNDAVLGSFSGNQARSKVIALYR